MVVGHHHDPASRDTRPRRVAPAPARRVGRATVLIAGLSARNKATAIITHPLLLALVLVVGGCASSHATAGLDEEAHGINCSGADRTWALCGERAAAICG